MNPFEGEYESLRTAATEVMRDTCKIGVRSASTTDDPNTVTYSYGSTIACGLDVSTKGEITDDGSQATLTDALLRLPWGTTITSSDRVQIVTQAGETLTDSYYAVDGEPYQCLINLRVRLKKLTGASVL